MKDSNNFLNRIKFEVPVSKEAPVNLIENIYGSRKVIQAVFTTEGCNMKKAGSCWNCNYGTSSKKFKPSEYILAFEKMLQEIEGNTLVLDSYGSITDPKEFEIETLKKIVKMAINSGKFESLLIETHITQISEQFVRDVDRINKKRMQIGFEVGVEDMNPENRKLINKMGVSNEKLMEVYEMLQKHQMGLEINLIYGLPFMTEKERIEAVINSLKEIERNLPDANVVLFLMSVKENTKMEQMYKQGVYRMPNPWGLIETIRKSLEDNEKTKITFSWFGEKETRSIKEETCYTCPECKKIIVECLKNINGTFDLEERKDLIAEVIEEGKKLKCECYEEFLEEFKYNDRKSPRNEICRIYGK